MQVLRVAPEIVLSQQHTQKASSTLDHIKYVRPHSCTQQLSQAVVLLAGCIDGITSEGVSLALAEPIQSAVFVSLYSWENSCINSAKPPDSMMSCIIYTANFSTSTLLAIMGIPQCTGTTTLTKLTCVDVPKAAGLTNQCKDKQGFSCS